MKTVVILLFILCLLGLLLPEESDIFSLVSVPIVDIIRFPSTTEELPDGGRKTTFSNLPLTVCYYAVEAELLDDILVTTLEVTYELNTEHPSFESGQEIEIEMLIPRFIDNVNSFNETLKTRHYKGGYVLEESEFFLNEQHKSKSVTLKQLWSSPARTVYIFDFQVKYSDYPPERVAESYRLPSNVEMPAKEQRYEENLGPTLELKQ